MFIFQFNSNNKLLYCSLVSSAIPGVCVTAVIVPGSSQQNAAPGKALTLIRVALTSLGEPCALHGPAGEGRSHAGAVGAALELSTTRRH